MSDWSKAFLGYEETPYGYAAPHQNPVGLPADYQPHFEEVVHPTFPEWDSHGDLAVAYGSVESLKTRVEMTRRRDWFAQFHELVKPLLDKNWSDAATVLRYLQAGERVKGALKALSREMQEDLEACMLEQTPLTLEWVQDFLEDYEA